jgi:hypothetical protein
MIIKDKYLLPLIFKSFNCLISIKFFTKLNIYKTYYKILKKSRRLPFI